MGKAEAAEISGDDSLKWKAGYLILGFGCLAAALASLWAMGNVYGDCQLNSFFIWLTVILGELGPKRFVN